jgi:hypothetical protein
VLASGSKENRVCRSALPSTLPTSIGAIRRASAVWESIERNSVNDDVQFIHAEDAVGPAFVAGVVRAGK